MIRRAEETDILLLAEGTYPYIKGGVSSWIDQLIRGLPHLKFGIVFLGSHPDEYGDILYDLPDNLVHLETHYLFEHLTRKSAARPVPAHTDTEAFETIRLLHEHFEQNRNILPEALHSLRFMNETVTHADFLYGKPSWEFIREKYLQNASNMPFLDYFWAVRNIHAPLWKLSAVAASLPKHRILHAPSTGYAGLLGTFASLHYDTPLLLTEHGIYTRERKIDLLNADWIGYHKLSLLKQPEEFNYIKQMWIDFFVRIGRLAYGRARAIFSLYPGAKKIQLSMGAPAEKCEVIPNGVDTEGLGRTIAERPSSTPPVVTLIGRVVSIKDIKTFIRAVRIAVEEMPEIEAWVVGPTDEDPAYYEECKHMVETYDLASSFHFKGFRNIKEILPQTGILTLTSISEGMPLTILEGFAAGVPCVATDVGSCRDLIYGGLDDEDIALGKAGVVTRIADPTALAEAYVSLLRDTKRWQSAQKTALARVRRYYRDTMFLHRYDTIYKEYL